MAGAHGLTDTVPRTQGVPQGGVLSPALFNMCLNSIVAATHAHTSGGPALDGKHASLTRLSALAYADDVVILAANVAELRAQLPILPPRRSDLAS